MHVLRVRCFRNAKKRRLEFASAFPPLPDFPPELLNPNTEGARGSDAIKEGEPNVGGVPADFMSQAISAIPRVESQQSAREEPSKLFVIGRDVALILCGVACFLQMN